MSSPVPRIQAALVEAVLQYTEGAATELRRRRGHASAWRRLDTGGGVGSQPESPSVEKPKETADLLGFGCEVDIVISKSTAVD